ncbi:MAG: outer membrane beta-barrel protein [Gemmatimonadota bacterium]
MNRRPARAAALVVLFSVFACVSAQAKPLSPNYATLKFGGFFPQHSDLDGFDSGFDGEVSFGHLVAPGFAVEGAIGYFETSGDFFSPIASGSKKFKVVPLTLSLKGQTFFAQFEPYVEAGIGVYFIRDELNGTILGFPVSDSDDDAQVGFHVGLGGNVNLTPQMFLGLEGRYLWLKTDTFGVDVRLDGITLTGNIGFRF